ncbi:PAS domain-containing sensor histidine kinase [Beijerinckia sp. L45]|uniref:hybrid sensor histidine kinase/response regulator n=1 Tax=Beijerinckia sp. L45 TaxID=1641855 RepID=UPI00131D5657|nr:PAS domain-containing sensor histidine kinase [Beijerinckia sp. L45]
MIRAFDWATTALGAIEAWPQSLKTAVGIVVHSPVPMVMLWGDDGFMIYNDAYSKFAGGRHPQLLGSKVREGWPEVADFNDHVMKIGLGGGTLAYKDQELTLYRNGVAEQVWMNLDYSPVFDESGRPAAVIAVVVETTARVQAEARIRGFAAELELRLQQRTVELDRVWRNSRDLLVVIGADGIFRTVNPAWTAILGHDTAEVIGHSFLDFIWSEDAAKTQSGLETAATTRDLSNFENRYRHKDGTTRWISWHTSVEGDLVYAYGRDVTASKEQASALLQAEEQLRQAQKMEAVGQLTGGIAHDFNNLLTGVIGSLDMMQRRISQGRTDRIERYATAAMTSANRAAALTHRLLAFSRRQPLDPKPTNANRLVSGMEELLRRTLGEAVRLEIVTAGGLWQTLCDPHQLESAILNLAINARDAMPLGGKLTIETCNAHLDSAYAAKSRDVRAGQYICICVTDTGTGMPPDVIARAFEPFFTTKPIGQGTGLGLSMIYGFTRQSEGYAKIYSELGTGTTIKLYLPRYYGQVEDAEDRHVQSLEEHRSGHGEVVLVVEDETAVRDLVIDVLQELGYRAIEAIDGPSGLKLLQSDIRIDLLVTDVGLPGLNGRQLADAARQKRTHLKVLFMTGYAENATIANGFLEPGMQMITKPFAIEALATRIRDMIEAEKPASSS